MSKRKVSWTPPNHVSNKEFVGRRVFGTKAFNKTSNSRRYKLDVFMDTRLDTGLSVDRLGVKAVCKEVLVFLTPLCETIAKKRNKQFKGWAQMHVNDLLKLKINIKSTKPDNEDNPYHAEICRTPYETDAALRSLAFALCVYASDYDFIEKPSMI